MNEVRNCSHQSGVVAVAGSETPNRAAASNPNRAPNSSTPRDLVHATQLAPYRAWFSGGACDDSTVPNHATTPSKNGLLMAWRFVCIALFYLAAVANGQRCTTSATCPAHPDITSAPCWLKVGAACTSTERISICMRAESYPLLAGHQPYVGVSGGRHRWHPFPRQRALLSCEDLEGREQLLLQHGGAGVHVPCDPRGSSGECNARSMLTDRDFLCTSMHRTALLLRRSIALSW